MVIKRIFPIINLMFIGLAIYLGVKGVYAVFSYQLDTQPPPPATRSDISSGKQVKQAPLSDFRPIIERNLFDTKTGGETPETDIMLDSLKETQLKLKLWGTVSGHSDNLLAIIEDEKARDQKVYKIGDKIQDATLKMIVRNKVVLSRLGKDEILEMEKVSSSSSTSSRVISSSSASVTTSARTGSTTSTTVSRRRISLSRAQVDSAMSDVTQLAKQINIQAHTEDGETDGFILSNIQPNSIFRRMGLRNGDILTEVDGQELRSVDDALKLYEDLKSSDEAEVQILRKGRPTILQYRIR